MPDLWLSSALCSPQYKHADPTTYAFSFPQGVSTHNGTQYLQSLSLSVASSFCIAEVRRIAYQLEKHTQYLQKKRGEQVVTAPGFPTDAPGYLSDEQKEILRGFIENAQKRVETGEAVLTTVEGNPIVASYFEEVKDGVWNSTHEMAKKCPDREWIGGMSFTKREDLPAVWKRTGKEWDWLTTSINGCKQELESWKVLIKDMDAA